MRVGDNQFTFGQRLSCTSEVVAGMAWEVFYLCQAIDADGVIVPDRHYVKTAGKNKLPFSAKTSALTPLT